MNPYQLRCSLRGAGYLPIPVNGKKPPLDDWTKIEATEEQIKAWDKSYAYARSTGILTRSVPALDIDVLNQEAAEAVEALAGDRFEERGYPLVRIGQAPKRAILFRTDDPFKKIQVLLIAPDGSEGQK